MDPLDLPSPPATPEPRQATESHSARRKRETLDSVMVQVNAFIQRIMDETFGPLEDGNNTPAQSSRSSKATGSTSSGQDSKGNSSRRQKRSRSQSDSEDESYDGQHPGGEDGDKKSRPLLKRAKAMRKFACPYFKHDPIRYGGKAGCLGPGWPSAHRMK
jgi:hypothetical protein